MEIKKLLLSTVALLSIAGATQLLGVDDPKHQAALMKNVKKDLHSSRETSDSADMGANNPGEVMSSTGSENTSQRELYSFL